MRISFVHLLLSVIACISVMQAKGDFLSHLLNVDSKDLESLLTVDPTAEPTATPTMPPTMPPTIPPTRKPTASPTSFMPTPAAGTPTARPTASPTTSAPTFQTSPIVKFESKFKLRGSTSATMNAAAKLALRNATAWAMHVSLNTVVFLRFTAIADNHRLLRNGKSLFTTQWSLDAITQLELPVAVGTNTTLVYIQKTTLLNNAVANDDFTKQLQKVAVELGADDLALTDVEGVENSAVVVDNDLDYPEEDDKSLTDGAIAGIVIGAVVFAALVIAVIYYFVYMQGGAQSHKVYVQNNAEVETA